MKILFPFVLYIVFLSQIVACKSEDKAVDPPVPADTSESIPDVPGWKLVWNDEFKGTAIDTSKWTHEVNGNGGGNNELQYYTDAAANSYLQDGFLILKAIREKYQGKEYTSARLNTRFKGDWKYGRFEIRAKLPKGKGLWPAIWMLPSDWEYGGWPASGEIDIMELLGHETNKVYGTIHYGSSPQDHQQGGGTYTLSKGNFADEFHVFQIEWDEVGMRWFVDGNVYHREIHTKPFDKRFHLLLNVAVGGNWPGNPSESTFFPQSMVVDYVRVYTKE